MNARALLAWNLRKIRVAAGTSQERLAADAGVDRAYLGGLERQIENPTIDLLERIAAALGVNIAEFFTLPAKGEQNPKPLGPGRKSR
jgi:transcriptional regulator with XRE-family HTH domain